MDETIVVNKFDLNSMVKNPTILLNAKRGSGKSVCIKHLLWYFGNVLHYPAGILCSKSESVDPFYQDFFPDSFIYDSCSDELFTKIFCSFTFFLYFCNQKHKKLSYEQKRKHYNGRLFAVQRLPKVSAVAY